MLFRAVPLSVPRAVPLSVPVYTGGSGDPNVVAVEVPDEDYAYLNANSVGSTRVYYMPPDAKVDKGFKVTVVP